VTYTPDLNFSGADALTITTTDNGHTGPDGPKTDTDTVLINVTPVNDAPVITGDLSATVLESGTYILTGPDLGFSDPDDLASGVLFTISNLVNGTVKVSGSTQTTFTGTQLASGQVAFAHNGSETTSASFKLQVEDENEDNSTPTTSAFTFVVSPVNDPPVITGDLSARVPEGGTYTLAGSDLGFSDPDDVASGVLFTVSNPVNGTVKVNGSTQATFTGTQLANGQVSFTHNGGETTSASFNVSVDDGNEDNSTPTPSTFNLTVAPLHVDGVLHVGVRGTDRYSSFLNSQGIQSEAYKAANLNEYDVIILNRTPGTADIAQWVNDGGLLITEWDASEWALDVANLLSADSNPGGFIATNTTINITSAGVAAGLSDGIGSSYSGGPATEFFMNFGNIGPGVEILETRHAGTTVSLGGHSGNGAVLVRGYDWNDKTYDASNGLDALEKMLLNSLHYGDLVV
jgi:Cadherin-like